ncbi:MAG: GPW/gp25 family protein [Anaerolineae bacterium]|nr:GPW/gp25 family protein [Anaerolineae bacterium]
MTTRPDKPLVGWPLWVFPDANGELKYPMLENSVRQSIEIILRTRPGEQLMKPEFGAGLADFLHEPNTLTTRTRIRDTILAALERWEGRIILDRVDVEELPDEPSRIQIEIAYRLRRTGAPQQVALTLELER